MWLDLLMDIFLGLPAVILAKLNPDILNTYILERTYINWIYISWHLDKIITHHYSPGVCRFALMLLSSSVATANVTSYHRCWMDYDMIFFGRDIDIVCIMHGVYQSAATTTTSAYYGLYQLLRLLTVIILVVCCQFCDGHVISSSSVLPLRSLESVVRCSVTVLYTLDMISRYFSAGLDRCSQIRHSRWMLLLFSDLSHSPDLIISQTRHLRRTLLSLTNSSAGFGLYPTRGVCGAAFKPLTVRCRTPGCTRLVLNVGVVVLPCTALNLSTSGRP